VRPRLRRLVDWWRGVSPASRKALPPPPQPPQDSGHETGRRLEDARRRL